MTYSPTTAAPDSSVANLVQVRAQIAAACGDAVPPTLIAVTKTVPAERIRPVIEAGQRHFGENRIQEAEAKWPSLRRDTTGIMLHLIGSLQTNKTAEAVALFDVIHTVDRPKLAEKLSLEMARQNRRPDCFIQINIGQESQKAGIDTRDADAFIVECREKFRLPIIGLMCVPPVDEEPSPYFALLREIARRHNLKNLSMGMSADFEIALIFGATHIRVGSAIFGDRPRSVLPPG